MYYKNTVWVFKISLMKQSPILVTIFSSVLLQTVESKPFSILCESRIE